MHVDGFRFDLASTLARELYDVDQLGAFFDIIHQDPVLSQVKLIAEPWDVGAGGYQVGNFPVLWTEWNGKYRDTCAASGGRRRHGVRVRHAAVRLAATCTSGAAGGRTRASTSSPRTTASRCTTSSATTRSTTRPTARTTATARTTTSAGTAASRARPTTRRSSTLRERQKRNFLATLLLSQGVPMLCAGDETRPHAARQQQRLLPGQRAHLARLGPDATSRSAARVRHAQLVALPADAAGAAAPQVLPGPQHSRRRRQGHLLARTRRPGDDRRGVERRLRALPRHAAWPATPIDEVDERGEPIVGDTLLCCSTPTTTRAVHAAATRRRIEHWQRVFDTADRSCRRGSSARRRAIRCRAARSPLQGDASGPSAAAGRRGRAAALADGRRSTPGRRRTAGDAEPCSPSADAASTDERRAPATNDRQPRHDDPLWYKDAVIYQAHVKRSSTATTTASATFPG